MSKILYPIFKLPDENDEEKEPVPTWIKWWMINNYKKRNWILSEILTGNPLTLENSVATKFYLPPLPRGNSEQATSILPTGYTQLDYIESTGTQYIDTGIYATENIGFKAKVKITNYKEEGGIFASSNSSNNNHFVLQTMGNKQFPLYITSNGTTAPRYYYQNDDISNFHDISYNTENLSKGFLDGSQLTQNNNRLTTVTESTFVLFARKFGTNVRNYGNCQINYFKIYDSGTLVRDYIPCKNASNEIGLYDLVTKTFFGNNGTGEFVAGNTVTIPNPDFEVPITNVTGDVEVVVQNKNLFDINKILYGEIDSNGDLSVFASTRDFYKIDFKENTQYTISGYVKRTSGNVRLRCMYTDGTYSEFFNPDASDNFSFSSFTSLANKTIDKIVVYYGSAGYLYIKDGEMQIEQGTTATTYTPHKEQTYTFPLGTQRMYLGDYLADDGIHRKRDIDIFDGSNDEVWALVDAYFVSPYIENVAKGTVNSICNIATIKTLASLSATDINKYAVQTIPNGRSRFYFRCSQFGTLDDWKAYLAENPVTVEYELAEEEITPYTTKQQQAYDEIKQAISYEEQTNISGTSSELDPLFEVQYYMENESEGE